MKKLYVVFVVLIALLPATLLAAPKRPPHIPTSPSPIDGAVNVATQVTVTCLAQFATSFDLFFDSETYRTASGCGFLVLTAPGTSHTWHIVAHNTYGTVVGPDWHFATASAIPPPPPPPPPGDWTFCANEGATCVFTGTMDVRYGTATTYAPVLTLTGGTPCTNDVFGDPAYGTFKHCDTRPTATLPPPPPPGSGAGATLNITCPTDGSAVVIRPGQDPAIVVTAGGTSFCFKTGVYYPSYPIHGRKGMNLYGELGAILDGRDVVQDWDVGSVGIIRVHNCGTDCTGGTIRNLVVRNAPLTGQACATCGGAGLHWGAGLFVGAGANNWTIDHVEGYGNPSNFNIGQNAGAHITFAYSHDPSYDCSLMGYQLQQATIEDSVFLGSKNHDCKFADSGNLIILRSKFEATGPDTAGLWLDTSGYFIPHTCHLLEDNEFIGSDGWFALMIEANHCAVVNRGSITSAVGSNNPGGLFISNSSNVTIDGATFNAPQGGGAFIFFDGRPVDYPVANNIIKNSVFNIGGTTRQTGFQCLSSTTADCQQYMLANNNRYENNTYKVPDLAGRYWYFQTSPLTWTQWQGLGQDTASTIGR